MDNEERAKREQDMLRQSTVTLNEVQWNVVLMALDTMHLSIKGVTQNCKHVLDQINNQLGRA